MGWYSFGFVGSLMVLELILEMNFLKMGLLLVLLLLPQSLQELFGKKIKRNVPLSVNNGFQAFGGCFLI